MTIAQKIAFTLLAVGVILTNIGSIAHMMSEHRTQQTRAIDDARYRRAVEEQIRDLQYDVHTLSVKLIEKIGAQEMDRPRT